ncbi:unannotated protein [freshwater metagenome]|uniref:Unannotated protein n=1 Tax=freshwater metagenome TaxID=449393 RepID=A0A6J6NZ90_9ZZZZ
MTRSIIRAVCRAAPVLTTRRSVTVSVPTCVPSSVVAAPMTRLGSMRTPSLAMVLIAAVICRALTETD